MTLPEEYTEFLNAFLAFNYTIEHLDKYGYELNECTEEDGQQRLVFTHKTDKNKHIELYYET